MYYLILSMLNCFKDSQNQVVFSFRSLLNFKRRVFNCNIDGFVKDCSISFAKALEILQSCTERFNEHSNILFMSCITTTFFGHDTMFSLHNNKCYLFQCPDKMISMAQCETAVSLSLMHCRYNSLVLSCWFVPASHDMEAWWTICDMQ